MFVLLRLIINLIGVIYTLYNHEIYDFKKLFILKINFHHNKLPFVLFLIIGLGILGYTITHFYVKGKIEKLLNNQLSNKGEKNYTDLDLSLIGNYVELTGVKIDSFMVGESKSEIEVSKIVVSGLSYFKIISSGTIEIESVIIDSLQTTYYKSQKTDTSKTKRNKLKSKIVIEDILLKNSSVTILNAVNDSLEFSAEDVTFQFSDLIVDKESIQEKIPFLFSSFSGSTGKIIASLNDYEKIEIESLNHDENTIIKNFSLKSKYNKVELQSKLSKERDYVNLKIPDITLNNLAFKTADKRLCLEMTSGELDHLNLEIYRNKLLPDDVAKKPMFSAVLKKLPIIVRVPIIRINDGTIKYSELIEQGTNPGEIVFTDVNSIIKNNFGKNARAITFSNKAKLMGVAPIQVEWKFYIKNDQKMFNAMGVIKDFDTKYINSFLKSNLQAKASGVINELYFTIGGNDYASNGDIKMKYNDFKFFVLKENRLGVNKILTLIGNIFTNDGSNADEDGYRYGQIEVERDHTKSFFNYLWINLKDGIVSTIVGNGKKD